MIRLNSKRLKKEVNDYLKQQQKKIDSLPTFNKQAKKAKALWNGKSKRKFSIVRQKLYELCVGEGICNYCENNEAIDIEHIFPKGFFPEKCFVWINYLLACKKCNTHHKLDNFAVFDPSNQVVVLNRGSQPIYSNSVMINPRIEEGMDFMMLDIKGKTFLFVPIEKNKSSISYKRTKFTIDLLSLNKRDALVVARKTQGKNFVLDLKRYVNIKKAITKDEVVNYCDPLTADDLDLDKSLSKLKKGIMSGIKFKIKKSPHKTIWQELKRQRNILPTTNALFKQAPEAIKW